MSTLPTNLRLPDLIAKTARVTLKDTVRVLHAVEAVARTFGMRESNDMVEDFTMGRPTPENIAACEQASFALREGDNPCRELIDERLRALQELM